MPALSIAGWLSLTSRVGASPCPPKPTLRRLLRRARQCEGSVCCTVNVAHPAAADLYGFEVNSMALRQRSRCEHRGVPRQTRKGSKGEVRGRLKGRRSSEDVESLLLRWMFVALPVAQRPGPLAGPVQVRALSSRRATRMKTSAYDASCTAQCSSSTPFTSTAFTSTAFTATAGSHLSLVDRNTSASM